MYKFMITNLFKFFLISFFAVGLSSVYVSDHGDFKLMFPVDYTIKKDTATVSIGAIPITEVFCTESSDLSTGNDNRNIFYLSVMEYPDLTFPKDSIDLMDFVIDQSIDQSLLALEGTLDYSSEIESENYYGKIVRISSNKNEEEITRAKFIIYKDYFIAIQVKTLKSNKNFRKSEDFLNSFKVINQ